MARHEDGIYVIETEQHFDGDFWFGPRAEQVTGGTASAAEPLEVL